MYKIGVDVGGTNTDAVLVSESNKIIAKTKQSTSTDIAGGIHASIEEVLRISQLPKREIKRIMLGTTHCTNALVERKGLNKVGAIRIGLPASAAIPTMSDFPIDLKALVGNHIYMVRGGLEYDGHPIAPFDENEVKAILKKMKGEVDSLAITGIFSKTIPDQEKLVVQWAKEIIGSDIRTSCSYQLGGLGLLERENATLLNAALQNVASKMVNAFRLTVKELHLDAQLYIGQNDGTLMDLEQAKAFPVLTISSGPTNSIRGAGALSKISEGVVIDVGGTTSDGGVLVKSFPRESTQATQIGGVMTNFRMPDVVAIGLGGGTIIRIEDTCTLGPDSVGHELKQKALAFGGNTLTLSDFFLATSELLIDGAKESEALKRLISDYTKMSFDEALELVKYTISKNVEHLVDTLKTNANEIPVIACGGGAFLLPKKIKGASEVVFPEHLEVANAFGASIAQLGAENELVINTMLKNEADAMEELISEITDNLIKKGAKENTIKTIAKESIPLAYLPGASRLKVKLCGELG